MPLKTLMAYSDSGLVADLTGNVTGEGKLEWISTSWKLDIICPF